MEGLSKISLVKLVHNRISGYKLVKWYTVDGCYLGQRDSFTRQQLAMVFRAKC